MKFDDEDLCDLCVLRGLPGWQPYPQDLDTAPTTSGVYLLADKDEEVLFIGATSEDGLRFVTMAHIGEATDRNAVKFRWVITRDDSEAKELLLEWVRKYKPKNIHHSV